MSKEEMTFVGTVQKQGRIQIPKKHRELMDIEEGGTLEVTVSKIGEGDNE